MCVSGILCVHVAECPCVCQMCFSLSVVCVHVSAHLYFCVFVSVLCLCWLTLGRSQEASAKTTQHDQQGPLHNRLHSAVDYTADYTDYTTGATSQQNTTVQQTLEDNNTKLVPFHQLPIFRTNINDDITCPESKISSTINTQNH